MDPQKLGFGWSSYVMFLGALEFVLAPFIGELAELLIGSGVDEMEVAKWAALGGAILAGAGILSRGAQAVAVLIASIQNGNQPTETPENAPVGFTAPDEPESEADVLAILEADEPS